MPESSAQQACNTSALIELEMPKMVRVVLLNDNYTTQEFVVEILQSIFHKSLIEAQQIMLEVHNHGKGICGIYPYDIGETKAQETIQAAQKASYPLKIFTESI